VDDQKKQFSRQWAMILGGSSGFGLAAVEKLAREGMDIAVLYRETAAVERTVREKYARLAAETGATILPFNCNALDATARGECIRQFAAAAGKKHCIKLLLHSIARGNLKSLVPAPQDSVSKGEAAGQPELLSSEDIRLTSYAMSVSLLDWSRNLLQEGLFQTDARIVGLTSEGAHKFWDGYAAVSMAKASLESLTTYMAIELGRHGLRTNLIRAGITETPSLKRIPGSQKLIELSAARSPLGRMTRPEDVAGVIYLLCKDEAAWINGAVIHVDGGEHCI
jgi:enoyl-[acyl-carrier protein] reductase III